MSLRLDQLLKACTVKIEISKGKNHGTGFFFAPKLILTCTHVIKKPVGEFVEIFPDGYAHPIQAQIKHCFSKEIDLAILQTHAEDSFPCVYLGTGIQPRDLCYTYGTNCVARSPIAIG
jgi:hypothetical protein